ncbi:MAG: 30S ribosomal protein S17e [Candidatus Pacearchaeota archaeon]|nr:30S ribosomal protein S17e [Candidatus Pacearchaeota archaeon]
MGRIKTAMIKRATHELRKQDINFSTDFNYNKKMLKNLMPSKRVRNKIAGYISRLEKAQPKE